MDLFDQQVIPLQLTPERHSSISFWPNWLSSNEADNLLCKSIDSIDWRADKIKIVGKYIFIPQLQQWFGDPGTGYTYSNIRMQAVSFPDWIDSLRAAIERQTGAAFNRALVNYYRDGSDSVDWHADNESTLGPSPIIASLSLGVERVFQLRHQVTQQRISIPLPHGSLLMMGAGIQSYWHHRIAKVKDLREPRVNFTFRYMG